MLIILIYQLVVIMKQCCYRYQKIKGKDLIMVATTQTVKNLANDLADAFDWDEDHVKVEELVDLDQVGGKGVERGVERDVEEGADEFDRHQNEPRRAADTIRLEES